MFKAQSDKFSNSLRDGQARVSYFQTRSLVLVANDISQSLSNEEVIRYFMSYGIRVDCQFSDSFSGNHVQGPTNLAKIYCPSKFTKQNLRDSAHFIGGHYLELQDPHNGPYMSDNQVIVEPIFSSSSSLQSFNSSKPELILGDVKVYFSQMAMEHGLNIKVNLVDHVAANKSQLTFRVLVSNLEEAKQLARVAHQVGSLSFRLVLVLGTQSTMGKSNMQHINKTQNTQFGDHIIKPRKEYSVAYSVSQQSTEKKMHNNLQHKHKCSNDAVSFYQAPNLPIKLQQQSASGIVSKYRSDNLKNSDQSNNQDISVGSTGYYQNHDQMTDTRQDYYHDQSSRYLRNTSDQYGQIYWDSTQIEYQESSRSNQHRNFGDYPQNVDIRQPNLKEAIPPSRKRNQGIQRTFNTNEREIDNTQSIDNREHVREEGRSIYHQASASKYKDAVKRCDTGLNQDVHNSQPSAINTRHCIDAKNMPADGYTAYDSHYENKNNRDRIEYKSSGPSYKDESYVTEGADYRSPSQLAALIKVKKAAANGYLADTPHEANQPMKISYPSNREMIHRDILKLRTFDLRDNENQQNWRASENQAPLVGQDLLGMSSTSKVQHPVPLEMLNADKKKEKEVKQKKAKTENNEKKENKDKKENKEKKEKKEKSDINEKKVKKEKKEMKDSKESKENKDKKEKKEKKSSKRPESASISSTDKYDTLLQICYGTSDELSATWIKRIYKLAENLKLMPHDLFGQARQEIDEVEHVKVFSDLAELHPLGKFVYKQPELETEPLNESDSEIENEPTRSNRTKYDQSNLVYLHYGHINFGGNHIVQDYQPWKGTIAATESILVGIVGRGRMSELPSDADYEVKAAAMEQAYSDVLEWKGMFRSNLIEQRLIEERKIKQSRLSRIGILNKVTSIDIDGKIDDSIHRGDVATKSSVSNRNLAIGPGLRSDLVAEYLIETQNLLNDE